MTKLSAEPPRTCHPDVTHLLKTCYEGPCCGAEDVNLHYEVET